ncbi:MAG: Fic family protein [Sinobacteraceae bacterium]|nr:Fic family protein [Nevskiaceae bacterium]
MLSLGRLDGAAATMPDVDLLLYTFVRKEAVLSSQIEGTQSTLDELLLHEVQAVPGAPSEDVREVSRYVDAMNHGLERIAGGFPLSNRLLREMHGILLAEGRGAHKQPGEFRRSQNWIGGTRPGNAAFVPPPPTQLDACLTNLEQYFHQPANPIVKAALAHVQFETIHPFLDGNGRVGRLLITLLFCNDKVLRKPLLYPSLYFKEHRQQYYEELNAVRASGDYERWIDFFAEAIRHSAEVAIETGRRVTQAFHEDRTQLRSVPRLAGSLLMIQEALQAKPVTTVAILREVTGLTTPTVNSLLRELESRGIVKESTGRARDRVYVYRRYLDALAAEEEAVAR